MHFMIPHGLRKPLLLLGHMNPLCGHLGKEKVEARLGQQFYWPKISVDMAQFCAGCKVCQLASLHKPLYAPLIPIPIIGKPFR